MKANKFVMWIENGVATIAEWNIGTNTVSNPFWVVSQQVGVTATGQKTSPTDPAAERVTYTYNLVPVVASEFTGGTRLNINLDTKVWQGWTEDDDCPIIKIYKELTSVINK